jgi:beta-lactamase class A
MGALADLDEELDAVPGTVSVWCAPCSTGVPRYQRLPDARHYAASTMKLAVLAALYRSPLDLDTEVPVRNRFASALSGAPEYTLASGYDNDDAVWQRLDRTASLRWLARRMIVRSSNLATNIVYGHVGFPAVAEVWRLAGATHSATPRGIEDYAARDAGIDNGVTAGDLGRLLVALHNGRLAGPAATAEMLAVLEAQERREDLAAGLPAGTRIAHKNGWVSGTRHGAAIVFPADAEPYALVVCTTTPLAEHGEGDEACALLAKIATASWLDRS